MKDVVVEVRWFGHILMFPIEMTTKYYCDRVWVVRRGRGNLKNYSTIHNQIIPQKPMFTK